MKKNLTLFFIMTFATTLTSMAQIVYHFSVGSAIGSEIIKDGNSYKSGFSPEFNFSYIGIFHEATPYLGLSIEGDLRLINVKNIDFFDKSYKEVGDLYCGILIGFTNYNEDFGLFLNGQIGYSLSGNGISDDTNLGSLSFKVSADVIINNVSIGVFYRPETQLIKLKSWASVYGWSGGVDGFVLQPSWGIKVGVMWEGE